MVWPPAGMMDTPGTRLGRWLEETPSGNCDADRVTTIFTGRPSRAMKMPLRSQPPIRRPANPLFKKLRLVPKGN